MRFGAILIALCCVATLIWGCDITRPKLHYGNGCKNCHGDIRLYDHNFRCSKCHGGDDSAMDKAHAHKGLVRSPSSPEGARYACYGCHKDAVENSERSLHYTMRKEIMAIWQVFFPYEVPPQSVVDLPVEDPLVTVKGLVADLLRRRCVRCHVYSRGDGYEATQRRLGCGACHMRPGAPDTAHRFYREVADRNCLACHHGNFVGWDYVGRFDKDLAESFQVPFSRGVPKRRAFGVDWLEMSEDVHRRLGYKCTACHPFGPCEAEGEERGVDCLACHPHLDPKTPGHEEGDRQYVACFVCHAKWSFNDRGRTLVRQDIANYWAWYDLRFQGVLGIERLLEESYSVDYLYWLPPMMADSLTGIMRPGIWYETFLERRFWPVHLSVDQRGRLSVARPILDLEIIYVDLDGEVVVEGLRPLQKSPYLPYAPHTIGKADFFRTIRAKRYLDEVKGGEKAK